MNYFWTNTIWYLSLGLITAVVLIYTMIRAEKRRIALAFYTTILGIILTFEMVILAYVKAYAYYPMIFRNPPLAFDDILAGNLFSQFSVSSTALAIAVFNLNGYWMIAFAGVYGLIEDAFILLGIYKHYWYRTWMTVVLMPFYFYISKRLYIKCMKGLKHIILYICVFLSLFAVYIITLTWGLMLFRLQDFSKKLFGDVIDSRHFLAWSHCVVLSIPIMIMYFKRFKTHWQVLVITLLYAVYYTGYKLHLLLIRQGWFIPVSTLCIAVMYLSVMALDRLFEVTETNSS